MNKCISVSLLLMASLPVTAGGYIFAGESNGVDIVTHPKGYLGIGGRINLSVCIDPTSSNSASLVTSVENIVEAWNQLNPVEANLKLFGDNNIPSNSQYDWESVTLHEVGHCIGLSHPNLGSQTGVSGSNTNYTYSTDGADNTFDFDDGADDIIGSSDDLRDDDVNLFYFNNQVNNPFVLSPPYDSTNYSRAVANLPGGDNFPANPDRSVGAALGVADTEGVMQQGTFNDEDQRRLAADDVVTIKYAMSGVDEMQGTADDYTYRLEYGGITAGCDINIKHDPTYTGFAVCGTTGFFVSGNHLRIEEANIRVNPNAVSWFYNDVKNDLIFKNDFYY